MITRWALFLLAALSGAALLATDIGANDKKAKELEKKKEPAAPIVVDGAMTSEGNHIPPLSCVFVYPEDAPFSAYAGPAGVDVIAMQFPRS